MTLKTLKEIIFDSTRAWKFNIYWKYFYTQEEIIDFNKKKKQFLKFEWNTMLKMN